MAEIWWCKAGPNGQNFGDIITPYIYKKITGKDCKYAVGFKNSVYIGAGSIMGMCRGSVIVWGSGIMHRHEKFRKPLEVRSVRGPITRRRFLELGYTCPEIYGDIGLILPRFYNPRLEKRYKLGILPHYVDYNFCKKIYADDPDVNVVDLCAGIEKVVDEIVQCERTISSSLHGIIASHAYGIKCGWVRFSEKIAGGFTKYHDYYGSVGISDAVQPKYIKERVEPTELIEFVESYENPVFPINTDKIMEVCPWNPKTPEVEKESGLNIVSGGNPLQLELSRHLASLLKSLGHQVQINGFGSHQIVIGRSKIPPGTNYTLLECDQPGTSTAEHNAVISKASRVWYFSESSLDAIKKLNPNATYLPFIYYPVEPVKLLPKEIDVCLLGNTAPRRDIIMRRLRQEGLNLYYSSTCWGQRKTEILAKTKIVLNIHFYPNSCQEMLRVLEGLSAGCVVVCEESLDKKNDKMLACDYVEIVPYDLEKIVAMIKERLSCLPPPEEVANCNLLKDYRNRLETAIGDELQNLS